MIPPSLIVFGLVAITIGCEGVAIKHYKGEYDSEVRAHQQDLAAAKALADQQVTHNKELLAQRDANDKEKADEHAKDDAARAAAAAGELARMRNSAKVMASSGVLAPSFAPKVCADAADNNRLRDALQRAKQDFGNAVASYREGVGRLLVECGKNTGTLTSLQSWQAEQEKIK